MTVGILAYPLGEDYGVGYLTTRTPRWAYRRALLRKSNPRSPEYMRELFALRYPEGRIEETPPAGATAIVLLYPDAIGLGFGQIERRLPRGVPVRVLNGRRRDFVLDRRTKAGLRTRRLLERTMTAEALFVAVLAAVTPFLLGADLVRGRR